MTFAYNGKRQQLDQKPFFITERLWRDGSECHRAHVEIWGVRIVEKDCDSTEFYH